MIIPIKYGTERININVDEFMVRCPSCETNEWAEIMVTSSYFHIYYIPIFPNSKDAYVCCKKCGLKRNDVPFNAKLIDNYENEKKRFRHPWFTYIGVGIIALPFLGLFIETLINSFQKKL